MDTKTAMIVFGIVSLVCLTGFVAYCFLFNLLFGKHTVFGLILHAPIAFGPVVMLISACTGGGGLTTLAGVLMLIVSILMSYILVCGIWLGIPPHIRLFGRSDGAYFFELGLYFFDAVLAVVCFIVCRGGVFYQS